MKIPTTKYANGTQKRRAGVQAMKNDAADRGAYRSSVHAIRPSAECGCKNRCLGPCVMGNCLGTCY